MHGYSRTLLAGLLCSSALLSACGSDNNPAAPVIIPPLGVSATPTSVSTIRVAFSSNAGDTGYEVERAEGAAGTFALATTIPAPAVAGALTYDDVSLKVNTLYRYRVTAVRGTRKSVPSAPNKQMRPSTQLDTATIPSQSTAMPVGCLNSTAAANERTKSPFLVSTCTRLL